MKKWTQEEVDQIIPDEYGVRHFPTGDYSGIKSFGEDCSFGEGCGFGEVCSFGGWCSFEAGRISNGRYVAVDRIGSEQRKTYFFKGDEGLFVRAGCWFSSLEDFKARVREVHSGTRHEREYLAACDLAEMMLEE